MKRWMLSLGLISSLAVTLPASAAAYTGDNNEYWYDEEISELSEKELLEYFPGEGFDPDLTLSRTETAELLHAAFQIEGDAGESEVPFEDVEADNESFTAVNALYTSEVIESTENNMFHGENSVKRGEFAVMLSKAAGLSYSGSDSFYSDVEGETADAVHSLLEADILVEQEDIQFYPDSELTSGEAAELLLQTLAYRGSPEEETSPEAVNNGSKDGESEEITEEEPVFEVKEANLTNETSDTLSLTEDEAELADLINTYREENDLEPLDVSVSLTQTARAHVDDSNNHAPENQKEECSLHSWSSYGEWTPVCYGFDKNYAEKSWTKPSEITGGEYSGFGFENSYWNSVEATPEKALNGWKNSDSHRALILGEGSWEDIQYMGVSIEGNYSHVWFGRAEDPQGYVE